MSTFDIVGHYDRLVQELPENPGSVYVAAQPRSIESAEVNSAIFLRGKSLFTSKEVPQGEVVFVERKLVSIVEPSSAKFVSTCDYCMRALGSLEDQIRFASRILRKKGTAAPTKEDSLEIPFADEVRAYTAERVASEREANGLSPQEGAWPIHDHIIDVKEPVVCPYGSGDKYCSDVCQEKAFKLYQRVFVDHTGSSQATPQTTADEEEEEDDEDADENGEVQAIISEEEPFELIKKKSLTDLVSSLRKYSKETNPLLLLACRAIACVAGKWEDEILRIAQQKVSEGKAHSLLELTPGSSLPVVTHEESTNALFNAVSPLLLFSQAPWWAQVQVEEEHSHGHGHSHGGVPCHGHGQQAQSHGHSHHDGEHDQAAQLQEQLFDLVQRTVNIFGPILVKFEQRVGKVVNVATLPADENEDEPEPPVYATEDQLAASVNDVSARFKWYSKICRFGPIGLANAFTIGCFMGMFEMNNIGTVSRAGFLDYVEFVAGELDEEDLETFRELLTTIYAKHDQNGTSNGLWQQKDRFDVSSKKNFVSSIRSRKLAMKKTFGVQRWNNLIKRAQEHPLGTGLYSVACCMNHSCVPNVAVLKTGDGRDDVSCFIAIRDIKADEELCISYIEGEDSLPTSARQEALLDYLFQCRCPKCSKPPAKKKVVTKKPARK